MQKCKLLSRILLVHQSLCRLQVYTVYPDPLKINPSTPKREKKKPREKEVMPDYVMDQSEVRLSHLVQFPKSRRCTGGSDADLLRVDQPSMIQVSEDGLFAFSSTSVWEGTSSSSSLSEKQS